MSDYLVCVTFDLENAAAFLPLARRQAAMSREEPGCLAFDVWTDTGAPGKVFLQEIYADRAAFEAHLRTVHFKTFDAQTKDLVLDKTVTTFDTREDDQ